MENAQGMSLLGARNLGAQVESNERQTTPTVVLVDPRPKYFWLETALRYVSEQAGESAQSIYNEVLTAYFQNAIRLLPFPIALVQGMGSRRNHLQSLLVMQDPSDGAVLFSYASDGTLRAQPVSLESTLGAQFSWICTDHFRDASGSIAVSASKLGLKKHELLTTRALGLDHEIREKPGLRSDKIRKALRQSWDELVLPEYRRSYNNLISRFLCVPGVDLAGFLRHENCDGLDDHLLAQTCVSSDQVYRRLNGLRNHEGLRTTCRAQALYKLRLGSSELNIDNERIGTSYLNYAVRRLEGCPESSPHQYVSGPNALAIWRRISSMPAEAVATLKYDLGFAFEILDRMPMHIWPATEKQWLRFSQYFVMLRRVDNSIIRIAAVTEYDRSKGVVTPAEYTTLQDAIDFIHFACELLPEAVPVECMPVIGSRNKKYRRSSALNDITTPTHDYFVWWALGCPSLSKLLAASRRWHDLELRVMDTLRQVQSRTPSASRELWPPLTSENVRLGGFHFNPLTDTDGLNKEGSALRHCVGSYGIFCASGDTHIISVMKDARHIATLQIGMVENRYGIKQLRGLENNKPDSSVLSACEQYLGALNSGEMPLNPEIKNFNYKSLEIRMKEATSNRPYDAAKRHGFYPVFTDGLKRSMDFPRYRRQIRPMI